MNTKATNEAITIGDLSSGRNNNFDFLRFFFATMVIFSHSFAFLYNPTWFGFDPLLHLTRGQAAFGGSAVDGFFLISGFLVTQSWVQTNDLRSFIVKRALRILPALAVVLVFCTFVIGPLVVQDRYSYFHNPATYRFLGLMFAKRIDPSDVLPGVFVHNPEPGNIDGSLWTIRYELGCYAIVAALGLIGTYKRRVPLAVFIVALAAFCLKALHVLNIHSFGEFDNLFHLVTYFSIGMLFYLYRDRITHSVKWLLTCIALLIVCSFVNMLPLAMPVLFGYVVFYLAFSSKIPLHRFAKHGDISYGLYLYACPIQQILVFYFARFLNPYTLFLAALLLTSACATMSWLAIEAPALRLKPRRPVRSIDIATEPLATAGVTQ